jgi:hypothetical protein
MSNTWPTARDGARFAARDLAMLDNFVTAALAEADDDGAEDLAHKNEHVIASHVPVPDTGDDVDAFLQRTVAFLAGRADRAQLLEQLRDAVTPAPPPAVPAQQEVSAQPTPAAQGRTPE